MTAAGAGCFTKVFPQDCVTVSNSDVDIQGSEEFHWTLSDAKDDEERQDEIHDMYGTFC